MTARVLHLVRDPEPEEPDLTPAEQGTHRSGWRSSRRRASSRRTDLLDLYPLAPVGAQAHNRCVDPVSRACRNDVHAPACTGCACRCHPDDIRVFYERRYGVPRRPKRASTRRRTRTARPARRAA